MGYQRNPSQKGSRKLGKIPYQNWTKQMNRKEKVTKIGKSKRYQEFFS